MPGDGTEPAPRTRGAAEHRAVPHPAGIAGGQQPAQRLSGSGGQQPAQRLSGPPGHRRLRQAMRVLHTADWHFGAKLGIHDRHRDHQAALEGLLADAREAEPDLIIHAGDVWGRLPPEPRRAPRRAAGPEQPRGAGTNHRDSREPRLRTPVPCPRGGIPPGRSRRRKRRRGLPSVGKADEPRLGGRRRGARDRRGPDGVRRPPLRGGLQAGTLRATGDDQRRVTPPTRAASRRWTTKRSSTSTIRNRINRAETARYAGRWSA